MESAPKRARIDKGLLMVKGCSKSALSNILHQLHDSGHLAAGLGDGAPNTIRNRVRQPLEEIAQETTPYGPLIGYLDLGLEDPLPYINPFGLLYRMSQGSCSFQRIMREVCSSQKPLRLVLYTDSIEPGNPLRPESGRNTEMVYWAFADWPDFVLKRADAWVPIIAARCTIIHKLEGGVSNLMRRVLHLFFPEQGHSLSRGVCLQVGNQSILVRGELGGFLADEKALKEIFGLKGASGSRPCVTCRNVVQYFTPADMAGTSLVGIDTVDYRQLLYVSSDDVYTIADDLRNAHLRGTHTQAHLQHLSQAYGVNYLP